MTSGSPRSGEARPARLSEGVLGQIDVHLKQRELRRSELYERARRLRRLAQGTMGRIHSNEDVTGAIAEIQHDVREIAEGLRHEGRGDEGIAHDAIQESVEAVLLYAVVRGEPLPGPADLGVDPEPFLMGLGDVAGELRRLALDRLAAGDTAGAEAHLATMEHIYRALMRFDTSRAIVALKPKQDVARSLLERTRGDVTMAKVMGSLRRPPEGAP